MFADVLGSYRISAEMLLTGVSRLRNRCTRQNLSFLLHYSTCETSLNSPNDPPVDNHFRSSTVDESHILSQLAEIFPVSSIPQNPTFKDKATVGPAVDAFLSPEDKLRGVFLQKLRGRNAVKQALDKVGVEISRDVVDRVVSRGNLSADSMVVFFNWAILQLEFPKDVVTYNLIVKALGRRKHFKHMMEMVGEMKQGGIFPNCETVSLVMDSFIRARQVTKAVKMWDKLGDFGLECNTEMLNVLLKCLVRRAYVGTTCSLMNRMRGKVEFDRTSYNVVIGGWSRLGRVVEVERNLEAMVEDGISPDGITYGCIIEGLGRAGQIEGAVKVFKELKETESVLDVEVYNAMIANHVFLGDIDEGMKFFEQLLSDKCELNVVTYVTLISGCLKARRVADAIEMFDHMLDSGIIPSTGTVTSFIAPLCGYGPPHAALMIYEKARKVGCRTSSSTYKLLLKRLSRFGKCQLLLNLWRDMQESGYPSDVEVYEYAIIGFCNVGQLQNAVLFMEECLSKGFCPSRFVYSKLNNRLMDSRKVEVAYRLFLKIKVARGNENAKRTWRAKGWHF